MGGRGASAGNIRKSNPDYAGITPNKWINTEGKRDYGYVDFNVAYSDTQEIIMDDRINYYFSRDKSYRKEISDELRNTEIVDIDTNYFGNNYHMTMWVRKKQKKKKLKKKI